MAIMSAQTANSSRSASTPRSRKRPSGMTLSGTSAATSAENTMQRPTWLHNASIRLSSLTAGPMTVKSRRAAAPTFP